jgi:hypothetical protein
MVARWNAPGPVRFEDMRLRTVRQHASDAPGWDIADVWVTRSHVVTGFTAWERRVLG